MLRIALVVCALAAVASLLGSWGWAQSKGNDPPSLGNASLDLKQQLDYGLKARRPVEFNFIRRVVEMVEAGILPRKLVDETFVWARKKPYRPFQYFEFALVTRAKEIGVRVVPADRLPNDDKF